MPLPRCRMATITGLACLLALAVAPTSFDVVEARPAHAPQRRVDEAPQPSVQPTPPTTPAAVGAPTKPTGRPNGGDTGEAPADRTSVTTHTVTIAGHPVPYQATAGTLTLKPDEDGKTSARIFYVAYRRSDNDEASTRPVTFAFNGGPGSSSVWLHLGILGPRRVVLDDAGTAPPPPPARLVDNAASLLDVTDLVFVDPVTTGYSRAVPPDQAKTFHGVEPDIECVGEFIRLWTTREGRWLSPKYVVGESYGTTRAAGLAAHMTNRHGLFFNGIILVSAVLDFQTISPAPGNDLPYALFLPTLAATAWYHHLLPPDLQRLPLDDYVQQARTFAETRYLTALGRGKRLAAADRTTLAGELARMTGLSAEYVLRSDLRIPLSRYQKELLRSSGRIIGRMDTRVVGHGYDHVADGISYDPSLSMITGHYTGALNHYVRQELKFSCDLPYEILTGRVHPWDWGRAKNRYVNVTDGLARAFGPNPHLRVFVANGYFDGATPFFATEYTMSHLDLPPALLERVTMRYYEGGHMMYTHRPSLERLKADLAAWFAADR